MSKAELISKIDRSLVIKKNELDILRRGRGDEVRKWERNVVEIEQRVAQVLRDMRESGLEKLSKASYNHAAKLTQNQTLLLNYRAKALLALDGEETEKLLKDFENDSKLSDANPISLCPQATVNGDDLVNLISNPDVKTELVQVPRPAAIDLEKQRYHSISFSLIENSKWQLPLVIGSRSDKGIELMNQLLFPFRSCTDLERTTPSQSKWNFGMTSFNDSFARVSFRIYNREDENLNQVLVIFLDDAKKQPRWTRSDQKFYRIPAEYSFAKFPAYTYHIWLTDKDNEWSQYGSNPIPLEKRNQIREFIGKYKTYDSTVPDVNCTVKLNSSRGKHEPWAYEGDIYLATMKNEGEPLPECSPSLSDFIATLQVNPPSEVDESEDETSVSADAPPSEEPQTEEKSSVQLTSSALDLATESPTPRMKSYHMNSEERWRNISSVGNPPGGAHEYEDEFWPRGGATLSQSAILNQYLNELGIKSKLEQFAGNPNLARYLSLLFDQENVIDEDSSGHESLDDEGDVNAAELFKYETLLAAEIIIWQINGSDSLRERLIMIQTVEYPEFSEFYHTFGLPCLYKKAYGLLCQLRYDQIPVQNSADHDSAFEDVFGEEEQEEDPFFIKRSHEGEYDYLPIEWPSLVEDYTEESQIDAKEDPSTSISPDIRPNESLEESNESFSSILSNEKNISSGRRNTRTGSMSENAERQITRTHDNSSDQISHSTPDSPPRDSSSSIPTCNSDEVSPEIPDEPEFETWEVHGKSNKQTKSSPDLIHGRAPKFGEDFKPRPNGNKRNPRSPDEGGFNTFNKPRSKRPNNNTRSQNFGGGFGGSFGGSFGNNVGFGHQTFPGHNDFDHRSSANRDRDVFLVKPNDRRFNAAREELNYGFGGSRYTSNNTLDPSRQRRNRRKASTDIGSVDRLPAYNNNNSAAKKSFVSNPSNPIQNRMVRIPSTNGWHSDYTSGITTNVNSKPKSRKVPPAPPRLNDAIGPVSGVTKLTGVNIPGEKYNEFERPVGRKKKECKTDVEDAYYHNRTSRKYRRREPFHGDESSNSSQEPDVEFGELQPGEGMSGMFTADETSNKAKTAYQPPPAPVSKTNSATIAELPRPCWKKTPDDDLFALITGISHWRQSEVKQLFEFCEPRDVRPSGKDWVLYFNDKVNMMTSRMIDGTELKKGSHGIIKVDVNPKFLTAATSY